MCRVVWKIWIQILKLLDLNISKYNGDQIKEKYACNKHMYIKILLMKKSQIPSVIRIDYNLISGHDAMFYFKMFHNATDISLHIFKLHTFILTYFTWIKIIFHTIEDFPNPTVVFCEQKSNKHKAIIQWAKVKTRKA